MSRLKKFWISSTALFIIATGGFLIWLSSHYVVPIMMYHNVNYTDVPKANTVSPQNFERQMQYLKDRGFHVLSFDELVQSVKRGESLPKKSAVITFDDAYEDNYTHAFKILKKYGFPAIIFAPSDLIGQDGHLNWEQIGEMAESGIAFGSHTRYHSYLPDLSADKQREEIIESKSNLEKRLGVAVDYFAYPIGGFSDSIKQIVEEAGYKGAAATNRGYDRFNKDVFELNRIRFSDKDDRNDYLWIKLSGYYNLFRAAKNPY